MFNYKLLKKERKKKKKKAHTKINTNAIIIIYI